MSTHGGLVEDEEAISFLVKRDPFDGFSVVLW